MVHPSQRITAYSNQGQLEPDESPTHSRRLNVLFIAIVFIFSFLTYFTEDLDPRIQAVPIVVFAFFVALQLMFPRKWRNKASIFAGEGTAVLWLVPVFSLGGSLASTYDKSIWYWTLDAFVLVSARLFAGRVSLREILDGFYWSGVICVGLLLAVTGDALIQAIETLERFTELGFHPNTLAFILIGFLAVAIWQVFVGPAYKKILGAITALACSFVIFYASSRGSLVAILVSAGATVTIICIRRRRLDLLLICLGFSICIFWLAAKSNAFDGIYDYIDRVLELSIGGRAMGSGMSGRVDEWSKTWSLLSHGSWFYGNGVRASDNLLFPVDNSFLVLLYDLGVIPSILIVGRLGIISWKFLRGYQSTGGDIEIVSLFMILAFTINNFTARYLFGVGNPFSLLMILYLVSPRTAVTSKLFTLTATDRKLNLDSNTAPA
jgi:hypothetical protein